MEILEIDGFSSFDYFLKYANNSVGMAKDLGTRFNVAMTLPEPRNDIQVIQYSYWQQRTHRNPFPKQATVYYKFQSTDGEVVEVGFPWTFKALKTYTGVDSFMEDFYAPAHEEEQIRIDSAARDAFDEQMKLGGSVKAPVEKSLMHIPKGGVAESVIHSHKAKLLAQHFPHLSLAEVEEDNFELLVNTTHLTFWALNDNQTMVMYLDDMAPDSGGPSGYYVALKQGFEIAAERGLTRLIIDLTNNGGGNICIGRTLLAFFQQEGWPGQGQK